MHCQAFFTLKVIFLHKKIGCLFLFLPKALQKHFIKLKFSLRQHLPSSKYIIILSGPTKCSKYSQKLLLIEYLFILSSTPRGFFFYLLQFSLNNTSLLLHTKTIYNVTSFFNIVFTKNAPTYQTILN